MGSIERSEVLEFPNATHDQLLARSLLVELLAHQFAFPVKWIDTQNSIFNQSPAIKRIIEIGPSATLANIAEKSLKHNALLGATRREILSISKDLQDILYLYSGDETAEATVDKLETPTVSPTRVIEQQILAQNHVPTPDKEVPDTKLTAAEIIVTIMASKGRLPFESIDLQQSIRAFSGGKSTMQNEIVGDLTKEFGMVPDGVEDMPIEALASSLGVGFTHELGKYTQQLVSSFLSTKMPAGFNNSAIRDYLRSTWGLQKDRQTAILCWASTSMLSKRLSDITAAQQFFNDITQKYAERAGISLSSQTTSGGHVSKTQVATISSSALDTIRSEQNDYLHAQLNTLAKHLGVDVFRQDASSLNVVVDAETQQLKDLITTEFDDKFLNGLQPRLDTKKQRRYDSWWNWAREDIFKLFHKQACSDSEIPTLVLDIRRILRRWHQTSAGLVEYLSRLPTTTPRSKIILGEICESLLTGGRKEDPEKPKFLFDEPSLSPKTIVHETGEIEYKEVTRTISSHTLVYSTIVKHAHPASGGSPYVHIRRRTNDNWVYDKASTLILHSILSIGQQEGLTFAGKTALVTGAGRHSIGAEIVRGLLNGGARVIVTSSSDDFASAANFYEQLYRDAGARCSELIVFPFNQGNKTDCKMLVDYLFDSGLATTRTLDFILPFAAISENGRPLDQLDGTSELAHRIMLVNLFRLLGHVKQRKEELGLDTYCTTVILPLSPNHGDFGGDGLYSESKIGLETLFSRWHSESWSNYLTVCGAVIGWTRGTGLMAANNILAESIESEGIFTFSTAEMAFNILALMTSSITRMTEDGPLYVDLSGGFQYVENLKEKMSSARQGILTKSRILKALEEERLIHDKIMNGATRSRTKAKSSCHRALNSLKFPDLPLYPDLEMNCDGDLLEGMVNLSQTVVVVGYSELGPWGNARTRWDMESRAKFSLESYVEMAWMMGLIKYSQGAEKYSSGWKDTETGEPVEECDMPMRYAEHILKYCDIREIEPEGLNGYDPRNKEFMQEIVLEDDLPVFEASKSDAEAYKRRHGDYVDINPKSSGSSEYTIRIKKGAQLLIPKMLPFDRTVAGQLPKGWDAKRYGIPEDIIAQVDPITLYMICCVAEAFLSAGIQDPFELYQHIHISEVANCLGTGVGGLTSMRKVYRDRYLGKSVQNDILQESFQNAHGAWVNMLLLGSTGPIRSPVGTCATGIESLDSGCELIKSGSAKVAIVGGSDDFQEEMSYEFGMMGATASSDENYHAGRNHSQFSRPMTTSRAGFVESAGCGVQILASAELALELGLPIYGVVAYTQMAGDTIGRSVPAPGQGILSAAKEGPMASTLTEFNFRRAMFTREVESIAQWQESYTKNGSSIDHVNLWAQSMIKDAQTRWTSRLRDLFSHISPIRSALASWGLGIDDIRVASLHATSTKANDKNEPHVWNLMMEQLGRSADNPLLCISQKYLTGHPKGAAGSWMLNGGLQITQTGIVPGNRNADNIDQSLREFHHLCYPSHSLHISNGVKAVMLTSFGFGQKGGLALLVTPNQLFAAIPEAQYGIYRGKALRRSQQADQSFVSRLLNNTIVQVKSRPPWYETSPGPVLLNPDARVSRCDEDSRELFFDPNNINASAFCGK